MAREDLILNLLARLHDKRDKNPPSKNEVLQKIQMVNDWMALDDAGLVTAVVKDPATFKWAGKPLAGFIRPSIAYLSDGTQVASKQPRYENSPTAGFGKMVTTEEGTQNLAYGDLSHIVGAVPVITPGQADPFGGTSAYLEEDTSAIQNSGSDLVADTVVADTQSYTLRVYLKQGTAATTLINFGLSGGTASYTDIVITWATHAIAYSGLVSCEFVAVGGGWYRLTAVKANNGTNTMLNSAFYPAGWVADGSTTGSCYISHWTVEKKPYATSYMLGGTSRSPEPLTFPTTGILTPTAGSVSLQVNVNALAKRQVAGQYPTILLIPRTTNSEDVGIWLYHAALTAEWHMQTQNDADEMVYATCSDSYTPDGMHLFELVYDAASAILYIDGEARITILTPKLPSAFAATGYLGSYKGTTHFINTQIDDVRLSSIKRAAADSLALATSGAPAPVDAWTTAKWSFDSTLWSDMPIVAWKWGEGQWK